MRINPTLLFLTVFIVICQLAICQPANDLCSNATSLDTLPAPAACAGSIGIHAGATVTLTGQTNVGATSSNPYPYNPSCGVTITSLPKDIWYSFTASAYQATVTVSSATFANPSINMWSGTCGTLSGLGCTVGSAGSAGLTVYNLNIGETYLIQIAGDTSQTGTFTLAVHNDNDCGNCLVAGNIMASPPPVNNTYSAGQTVTFCATVTDWNEISTNWFHGIVPTFGAGWDTTTLIPGSPPAESSNDPVSGSWAWYPSGVVSSATGISWPAGYYFNSMSPNGGVGGPGNSYGDGCQSDSNTSCTWQFCMTITARQNLSTGTDLSATFRTNADGQSGAWSNVGCQNDQPLIYNAVSGCGTAHATVNQPICAGDSFLFDGHYLSQVGTYVDTVIVSACDTVITTLSLNNCVNAGPDQIICQSSTVRMAATGTGAWSSLVSTVYIDTPSSPTTNVSGFAASGTYGFVWTTSAGSDTMYVRVNTRPVANYTLSNLVDTFATCPPLLVNSFIDNSTNAVSYLWNFGDGGATDTAQDPAYMYVVPGIHPVTETVTSAQGCTDSITKYDIHVGGPGVTMAAYVSSSCPCTTVDFYISSVGADSLEVTTDGGTPFFSNISVPIVGTILHPALDTLTVTYCNSGVVMPSITALANGGCTAAYNSLISPLSVGPFGAGTDQTICLNNTATMAATGTGTWTSLTSNPAVALINALSSPTTTISGFTADGTYGFIWANGSCTDTVLVYVMTVLPINFTETNINCYGDSIGAAMVTVSGGTTPYTYTWSPAEADTNSLTGLASGIYSLTVTSHNGCSVTAAIYISQPVAPLTATTGSIGTAACDSSNGSITISVQGGTVPYSYSWGASLSDTTGSASSLAAGIYCVTVSDASNCFLTLCDTVLSGSCPADTVWPGDADNNHTVDNNDLLAIGLGYDSTGTARAVQGNIWQGYSATDWVYSFTNYTPAVNYVHADCNGDGIIDADDTLAIVQNFGDLHSKAPGISASWRSGIPALYAVASHDTLHNGDTLTVSFVLGNASMPVNNFYAVAFTYNFDPAAVDVNSTTMNFENSSWIGSPGQDISLSKVFNAGQVKAAVTRINHSNVNGNGLIAEAKFKVEAQGITGLSYSNIGSLSDVTAIDDHGSPIPLNAGTDTTVIVLPNGIRDIATETLHIQPNPAHDRALISAGNIIRELSITDIMGQQVMDNTAVSSISMDLNISAFGSGIYFITIRTDRGAGVAKLIVER